MICSVVTELKLLERAGQIQNLELQKEFELIPTQREADTVGIRGGIKKISSPPLIMWEILWSFARTDEAYSRI